VWRTCLLDNKAACRVRLQFGGIEFIALRSLLSVRRTPREFKGLQSEEAGAAIPSSVGGVFGRSKKVIVGDVAFWEHRSANGCVEFMKQALT
jgi:hypothetical protein